MPPSSTQLPTGSAFMGGLRLLGFFTLIFAMTPFHIVMWPIRSIDPFLLPRIFHRLLTRLMGYDIRSHGQRVATRPVLYVANHTSYLDIPALASLIPAAFVAKREVAGWPVIGILAKLQHTVFIERRAARAVKHRDDIAVWLQRGQSVILFPEGTSTDGTHVLPFKSSLFSLAEGSALDAPPLTVQPVTIVCTGLRGRPLPPGGRDLYAWYGDMVLTPHLWRAFKLGHFTIDVTFHPPVTIAAFANRKALADYCQKQVAAGVAEKVGGRE